jgi:hypothetical protein
VDQRSAWTIEQRSGPETEKMIVWPMGWSLEPVGVELGLERSRAGELEGKTVW